MAATSKSPRKILLVGYFIAAGGILSITLHKIACDVLLPDVYEHEGLPVFEFTLLFSPVGVLCGMMVGLLVWVLAFLHKLDTGVEK